MPKFLPGALLTLAAAVCIAAPAGNGATRRLRFVQDDAQDYMVSKIYRLKYVQANDVAPFVLGMVMRYNMNSSVNNIEYGADNSQLLTVSCPVGMMPYVDDFVAKVDRDVRIDGKTPGDVIKGSGITRAVYQPKFRGGQNLLNVLVNSVIGEGPYGSLYAYDANSNQLYWKDNSSNSSYVFQFLGYLDRPAPQITLKFTLYEVRESTLKDVGVEYLAWKNGPGLNVFQAAFQSFSLSSGGSAALSAVSGPAGGFFFAPQFDASFIRLLAQTGRAEIRNRAALSVVNSETKSYSLAFDPQLQNIVKTNNDQTSVVGSDLGLPAGASQLKLTVSQPIVNLHYGSPQQGYPATEAFSVANYTPGTYSKYRGTLFFGYTLATANAVERNDLGQELVETSEVSGNALIELGKEITLGRWEKTQEVEQVIGVPYLCDIPVLKYLFSTTTTSTEQTRVYLTVTAEMLDFSRPAELDAGVLKRIK